MLDPEGGEITYSVYQTGDLATGFVLNLFFGWVFFFFFKKAKTTFGWRFGERGHGRSWGLFLWGTFFWFEEGEGVVGFVFRMEISGVVRVVRLVADF